jgi:hypothetical protein
MFLLPRKGQLGEILEKEVEIFLIFVVDVPTAQKNIRCKNNLHKAPI